MIAASGAIKHEDLVGQVKGLFTNLSADPTTASQLVAKEPSFFTGSEVTHLYCIYLYLLLNDFAFSNLFFYIRSELLMMTCLLQTLLLHSVEHLGQIQTLFL